MNKPYCRNSDSQSPFLKVKKKMGQMITCRSQHKIRRITQFSVLISIFKYMAVMVWWYRQQQQQQQKWLVYSEIEVDEIFKSNAWNKALC